MSRKCEQGCGETAVVYAGGTGAGDWAGYYCSECTEKLQFQVFNVLKKESNND